MDRCTVRRAIAFVAYYLGLDALMYRLNRRAKRIITFHNVLPDDIYDSARPIGCMIIESDFKRQIAEISRCFRFSTDIFDASTATITFDDGLLSQYEIAARDMEFPGIVFVTGNAIDTSPDEALITDKILVWNEYAPDDAVQKVFGVTMPRNELWAKFVQPAYREDWRSRGREFLARLDRAYPVSKLIASLPEEWVRLRMSGCKREHLVDLMKRGWRIGWHTKSHFALAFLDSASKKAELESPYEYKDVVLSYPYGDIGAIGEESLKLAEELGYSCAVSNDPDFSPHRGRFFLQRMSLSSNKYELHFVLSGLKYFLKFRKFLPQIDAVM